MWGQVAGGILGTVTAHVMFGLSPLAISTHGRAGAAQLFSEFVATFAGCWRSFGDAPAGAAQPSVCGGRVHHGGVLVHRISSFQRLAAGSNADLIAFGHTHQPYTKAVDGVMFLNAGSVGKPKDGDWRACYVLVDLASQPTASFRRLPYHVRSAADAIRATDLPHEFASDIETGGAPRPISAR